MSLAEQVESGLREMFVQKMGEACTGFTLLPQSGSNRKYFRLVSPSGSLIGSYNPDSRENRAAFSLGTHFFSLGLPVPEIMDFRPGEGLLLMEDLGDTGLLELACASPRVLPTRHGIPVMLFDALKWLAAFQIQGADGLDFSVCYPREAFDAQSITWDLSYFKYYFLKPSGIDFDEQFLEDDFEVLKEALLKAPSGFFMYRDFQSRNIMVRQNRLYFIDFQGGRKGPLAYDPASFLNQARLGLSDAEKHILLDHYITEASRFVSLDRTAFLEDYRLFSLVRVLQVLGAYGFRGWIERKEHFIQSIPQAAQLLPGLLSSGPFPRKTGELQRVLEAIARRFGQSTGGSAPEGGLEVSVLSFSYRKGWPHDASGNGGGFVFDCRGLPNPGRLDHFKTRTGYHPDVKKFLENEPSVGEFLESAERLVGASIRNYLDRGFLHLQVAFGCTGGQHRSVYSANFMADWIKNHFPVRVVLTHREIDADPFLQTK